MATSTLAHIVDTLVDLLDNDTTWQVVRVFAPTRAGTSTKPTLYPYVVSISYPSGYENGKNDGYGTAACEIIATAKVANDASGAGLGTIETGRIAKEVMRRLLDADVESIARNDVFSMLMTRTNEFVTAAVKYAKGLSLFDSSNCNPIWVS